MYLNFSNFRGRTSALMNGIFWDWFGNPKNIQDSVFDHITSSLLGEAKVPKHVYSILRDQTVVEVEGKWMDLFNVLEEVEWEYILKTNFTCTFETQLRSFYFKLFHRAICTLNQFLHKIGRADNPNCYFCSNLPKSLVHLFCNVIKFLPSGMSYVSWLIISLGKHSIFLILIKCLALLISLSMTIV